MIWYIKTPLPDLWNGYRETVNSLYQGLIVPVIVKNIIAGGLIVQFKVEEHKLSRTINHPCFERASI